MAVIQDEQGNNKPIVTDTSHVFDVNGNPLHGELFIGETIALDDVEEIDPFAHMSDVEGLIKRNEITETTSASYGNIATNLSADTTVIMDVYCSSHTYAVVPFVNGGVWTFHVEGYSDHQAIKNTQVTLVYRYATISAS